jgi:hypothetical protein
MRHIKLFENFNYNIQDSLDYEEIFSKIYSDVIDSYINIFPEYGDDNEYGDDYKFESRDKAIEYIDNLIDMFDTLPNPIPIYRCISAKSEEDIDLEYGGESWSYEKQCALNFGSRNGSNYLLEGLIDKQHVNWLKTILVYLEFSENYTDEDENEIVVEEQTEIKNIKIIKLKNKGE